MIPTRPFIDCSPTSDSQAAAILERDGPAGVVKHYAIPAFALGYGVPILRMIPAIDWGRIDSWKFAFKDAGLGWTLYFNPRNMTAADVCELIPLGCRFIVEGSGMGENGWLLGALKSVGLLDATEPAIDKASPIYAWSVPAVITDSEWHLNYRAELETVKMGPSWSAGSQVPPWESKGGCWRWYQPAADPAATRDLVLKAAQAWCGTLDPAFVKCAVVPADLAATYSIRASEIAGVAA